MTYDVLILNWDWEIVHLTPYCMDSVKVILTRLGVACCSTSRNNMSHSITIHPAVWCLIWHRFGLNHWDMIFVWIGFRVVCEVFLLWYRFCIESCVSFGLAKLMGQYSIVSSKHSHFEACIPDFSNEVVVAELWQMKSKGISRLTIVEMVKWCNRDSVQLRIYDSFGNTDIYYDESYTTLSRRISLAVFSSVARRGGSMPPNRR